MKKTIQINLSNRIFHIEEDAYHMLDEYLRSIEEHYRKDDPEGEIRRDFEDRIADLLTDKTRLGYPVVTPEIVGDVISRVGNAEQIFEEVPGSEEVPEEPSSVKSDPIPTPEQHKTYRKFYRDTRGKMLFGVLAGIAAYFKLDANLVRILFIILLFTPLNWALVICYFAFAIFTRPARTVAERLEMFGEEVSPDSIWQKISEESRNLRDKVHRTSRDLDDKYKLRDQMDNVVTGIRNETKNMSVRQWFWWGFLIFVILIIGLGLLNFFGGFGGVRYFTINPFWEDYYYGLSHMMGSSTIATLVSIPIVILVLGILFTVLFCLTILPIGLILRLNTAPLMKVILIVAWCAVMYSFLAGTL